MNLCEKCAADCRNKHAIEPGETVVHCGDYKPPMTNGDRLRAMSDEELAEMMVFGAGAFGCGVCREPSSEECDLNCDERCLEWLRKPVEEG